MDRRAPFALSWEDDQLASEKLIKQIKLDVNKILRSNKEYMYMYMNRNKDKIKKKSKDMQKQSNYTKRQLPLKSLLYMS